MIEFSHVTKRYDTGHEALRDISFRVDAQEMVFLTGHSGAGKSTLLKLLLRLEAPTRGQIVVNQVNVNKLGTRRVPYFRREIGVVYQDNKLLPDRSTIENVALPLRILGMPQREIERRARAALEKVGLGDHGQRLPLSLSGGEQQRVGIARAMVARPKLLLADEPTGNLDAAMSDDVMNLFVELNAYGVTVVVATHDTRQVARLAKRVIGLDHGHLSTGGAETGTH